MTLRGELASKVLFVAGGTSEEIGEAVVFLLSDQRRTLRTAPGDPEPEPIDLWI